MHKRTLAEQARTVLKLNDLGNWTRPTAKLYPHQWLWDSAFISIGLRHLDPERAKNEIRSLFKGQWKNGMIPYIIFGEATEYHAGPGLWKSHVSPQAPKGVSTTGGTQPPMIAEAVVRIGASLPKAERLAWYREVYPYLSRYHEWLYTARDPKGTGLVALYHSWETGLDNNPAWMQALHDHALSRRLWLLDKSKGLMKFLERFRRDTSVVPASERMTTLELLAFYDLVRDMRALKYDDAQLFKKSKLLIQDVNMNSILVRATQHLGDIAEAIGQPLPPRTQKAYDRGVAVLEKLWDEKDGMYYSRDLATGKLMRLGGIASFIPLYAGKLPKERVKRLVQHLKDPASFGAPYLVPSAPLNSPYFMPHRYWQGPSWINMNWLVMHGLRTNGHKAEADKLRHDMLKVIEKGGMYEYFSPLDGSPAGAPNFSWTASLTLELLNEQ
jgi:hypothetical protein